MSDIIKSIDDRYSNRADPRRGYHDSVRTVTFVAGSSEAEQREQMESMRSDLKKHNMWVHGPTQVRENVWTIGYGYDSGD